VSIFLFHKQQIKLPFKLLSYLLSWELTALSAQVDYDVPSSLKTDIWCSSYRKCIYTRGWHSNRESGNTAGTGKISQ